MLLHLRGTDGREQIGSDRRGRERGRRGGGIALVRHGRRSAASGRGRLERLRHLGLHQQRNIAGDLAAGAGEDRECRGDLGQPVAVAVPGRLRKRQIEQCGEPLRDLEPAVAERGERAGRAAELQHQRLAPQPLQPLARTRQRRRVAGELEPERHGHGVLHPGARHGGGAAMTRGERGEPCDGAVEVGDAGHRSPRAARARARCR